MSAFFMAFKYWILASVSFLAAVASYLIHPLILAVLGPILLGVLLVWWHTGHQIRDKQLRQYQLWWGNWGACRHGH